MKTVITATIVHHEVTWEEDDIVNQVGTPSCLITYTRPHTSIICGIE